MENNKKKTNIIRPVVKRGEVWVADLGKRLGREEEGIRPVIVLTNMAANLYSDVVIVAPLTTKGNRGGYSKLPTHVEITLDDKQQQSIILLEQITCIDKKRLIDKVLRVEAELLSKVSIAALISLGFFEEPRESCSKEEREYINNSAINAFL